VPLTCGSCGSGDGVRVYPMYPRRLFLCREHAAEYFKERRRKALAEMARSYARAFEDPMFRATAHWIVLRHLPVGAAPELAPAVTALHRQALRYFLEFDDQAKRAFPNYRDRGRARGHKARAEARGALTMPYDVPWLRRLYGNQCAYCGVHGTDHHIDHVWPLVLSGDDAPWNVVPACEGCNLSKGGKPLGEWLPGRPGHPVELWTAWAA
jgi:hypothetical protein